jgi:hypothetical protein
MMGGVFKTLNGRAAHRRPYFLTRAYCRTSLRWPFCTASRSRACTQFLACCKARGLPLTTIWPQGLPAEGRRLANSAAREGGKHYTVPCHHALLAYIDVDGIAEERKGYLFRTARGHAGTSLSEQQ